MKCLRCNSEMEKANVVTRLSIYSDDIQEGNGIFQKSYSPKHAYVCHECGYVELNYKD